MISTLLGNMIVNLIVGGLVVAIGFMLYAAGRELLGLSPMAIDEDQGDDDAGWADTENEYQRWIAAEFGL